MHEAEGDENKYSHIFRMDVSRRCEPLLTHQAIYPSENTSITGGKFITERAEEEPFLHSFFQLAIIAPGINLIGYDTVTAQSSHSFFLQ